MGKKWPLSQAEIAFYKENGYLLLANIVDQNKLNRTKNKISEYMDKSKKHSISDEIFDLDPQYIPQKTLVSGE